MQFKHEVFAIFVKFKLHVENLFSSKIKTFQLDNGGEYSKWAFQIVFINHGISFRSSFPSHPKQNGLAKQKHHHIVDTSLTLLARTHMSATFWLMPFKLLYIWLIGSPLVFYTKSLHTKNLFHKSLSYESLHVFSCACFPYLRPYNIIKLQIRSKRCVYLGYLFNHQGYHCLDPTTSRLYLSCHVVFDEHSFPSQKTTNTLPVEAPSSDSFTPALEIISSPLTTNTSCHASKSTLPATNTFSHESPSIPATNTSRHESQSTLPTLKMFSSETPSTPITNTIMAKIHC